LYIFNRKNYMFKIKRKKYNTSTTTQQKKCILNQKFKRLTSHIWGEPEFNSCLKKCLIRLFLPFYWIIGTILSLSLSPSPPLSLYIYIYIQCDFFFKELIQFIMIFFKAKSLSYFKKTINNFSNLSLNKLNMKVQEIGSWDLKHKDFILL
jgi:hypothetical protein